MTKDQIERTKALYLRMPGATQPSYEEGQLMWGEVDCTDEWEFCAEIVRMIDAAVSPPVVFDPIAP